MKEMLVKKHKVAFRGRETLSFLKPLGHHILFMK